MKFEQFKKAMVSDYELFAAALTGRYLAIVAAVGSPAAGPYVEQFVAHARFQVTQYIVNADARIDQYAAEVADGVDVDGRISALKQSLRVIAVKNSRDLTTRLRSGNEGLKSLFNRPMGAVGLLLQRQLAKPDLKSVDAAGRNWDSSRLVGVIARDYAYQTQVDAQAASLSTQGDLAQVVYQDPAHDDHGTVVSLTGETPDYPSFSELRKSLFHPNSSAQLSHV